MSDEKAKRRRVEEIEAAIKRTAPYAAVPPEAAENLYRMVDELKKIGCKKKEIAHAAWGSEHGDVEYHAKQLARVTLAPGNAEKRKSPKALDKKATHYVAVAEVWARRMGRDRGEALLRLFGNTKFGLQDSTSVDDNYDPWELLAEGLRSTAYHVIRLHKLQEYYKTVEETVGHYDARWGFVMSSQSVRNNSNTGGGLALSAGCSDEIEPLPSIRLARRLIEAPKEGSVWIAQGPEASLSSELHQPYVSYMRRLEEPTEIDIAEMVRKNCTYRLWLEVRLAIGPVFSTDDIGPLLEIRTNLEPTIDGQTGQLDNPYTDGFDVIKTVQLGNEVFRLAIDSPFASTPSFESSSFDQPTHGWFAWAPVGSAQLKEVLANSTCLQNGSAAFECHSFDQGELSLFPRGHMGEIERRLRKGELDRDLGAQAQVLSLALERHRASLRQNYEAALEILRDERRSQENAEALNAVGAEKGGVEE